MSSTSTAAIPGFLYGTAWKEERTEALVLAALQAGFRGIDTANQRKHYVEDAVGRALARFMHETGLPRAQLFIQTKFTFRDGQDQRLPYDPRASIAEQVAQSFASSQLHLGVDMIDSLVLHGPSQRHGLGPDDREAWQAMEALQQAGRVRFLGISNVTSQQLSELLMLARVQPKFVQNRCYAERGWDRATRAICQRSGISYQGFSLLTANQPVLRHPKLRELASAHAKTPAQIVFRFAQQLGMLPLTGTSDSKHMIEDLAIADFVLSDAEIALVERLSA